MIPIRELKEIARTYGLPLSTIERDYVQNWVLKYMAQMDSLVLKGGTGIRKAYFADYRFSDDLDFTLTEVMITRDLGTQLNDIVEKCGMENHILFVNGVNVSENINGFKAEIYFQLSQKGSDRTKIKIDITKPGDERVLLPVKNRSILHPYSDLLDATVSVYSLEEIMAEKIRSIFQRTRPRDLYDIWYLWDRVDIQEALDILPHKIRGKGIEPDITDVERRKNDFRNAWVSSLRHQVSALPDFDKVFESMMKNFSEVFEGGMSRTSTGSG